MPTDAIPWWIAIGVLLIVGYIVVHGVRLCESALRSNGEVDVEVKSSIASIRLRARAGEPPARSTGEGNSLTQDSGATPAESDEDRGVANNTRE